MHARTSHANTRTMLPPIARRLSTRNTAQDRTGSRRTKGARLDTAGRSARSSCMAEQLMRQCGSVRQREYTGRCAYAVEYTYSGRACVACRWRERKRRWGIPTIGAIARQVLPSRVSRHASRPGVGMGAALQVSGSSLFPPRLPRAHRRGLVTTMPVAGGLARRADRSAIRALA
jgi:hypothetical protein